MRPAVLVLLTLLGQVVTSLHLTSPQTLRRGGDHSRRTVVGHAAALLLPFAISVKQVRAATVEIVGQEVVLDFKGTAATVEVGGQEVVLDFKGQETSAEFREAKKRAIEQEKKAAVKRLADEQKARAKAAQELEAKAKKVNDKRPPSFEELLSNSVKQREAQLGMSMTEEDITALEKKLRTLYSVS